MCARILPYGGEPQSGAFGQQCAGAKADATTGQERSAAERRPWRFLSTEARSISSGVRSWVSIPAFRRAFARICTLAFGPAEVFVRAFSAPFQSTRANTPSTPAFLAQFALAPDCGPPPYGRSRANMARSGRLISFTRRQPAPDIRWPGRWKHGKTTMPPFFQSTPLPVRSATPSCFRGRAGGGDGLSPSELEPKRAFRAAQGPAEGGRARSIPVSSAPEGRAVQGGRALWKTSAGVR